MARLVWKRAVGDHQEFPLGDSSIIGRDRGTDLRIDSRSVSRRHARVERRDPDFYIVDLGSRNGTAVNGEEVIVESPLRHGDEIRLGQEVLEFDLELQDGTTTRGSLRTEPLSRSAQGISRALPFKESGGVDSLPRRLGKFYLVRKLGQGGMGVVYHALDLDSNREVAVKFIKTQIGRKEAFIDFFHNREAVLARDIEHPNVITVFEHGVAANQHYISMEYVPGRNLYHALKRSSLEPEAVLELLRQITCGLAAAHRRGVVHSDIKPANILLLHGGGLKEKEGVLEPREAARDTSGILEFLDDSTTEVQVRPTDSRYEPGLLDEIRRRVGDPGRDVILDPPYYQRASETGFLDHYFDRIFEKRGYLLVVEGDAGVGKKRLVSEFLREKQGFPAGVAESGEGGAPRFFELDSSRIEGLPLLYEQIHGLRPLKHWSARQMLHELVRHLEEHPLPRVLRILNMGSATPPACDFITACCSLMERQGLLLIATLDTAETHKNVGIKTLMERVALVTKELYLRPLTEYQIQRYLQKVFPDVLSVDELASDLYRLSRGNFGKLLDILRSFFERKILSVDQPSGSLHYRPRAQEFELEEGKNFYEKYRTYGTVEQRILEQAAFIGPTFFFDMLQRLNDLNETSLYFIIRTLLADGFFLEDRRGWYTFSNAAFQEYLAGRVPPHERPHLHRKISRVFQTVTLSDSPELFRLKARHLAGCREFSKAVRLLLEGAFLARNEYRGEIFRETIQEILRIYRSLARQEGHRREVTGVLRDWFRRDGNWYEILSELASDSLEPMVKITDFGISFRQKDEERGYQVEKRPMLGTPRYMAPERSRGEYGGFKSDIFALGIITYEMLAGEPPFPTLKGQDVVRANRECDITVRPHLLKGYPAGLERLIDGMLERDPARRWDAERVLREIMKLQFDARMGAGSRSK